MKRIVLKPAPVRSISVKATVSDHEDLLKISDYAAELRLLKNVPFSYLIADKTLLPPESIRFFYLDENWLNALTDGALSIGRVSGSDAELDSRYLEAITNEAIERLHRPRFKKMHINHRSFKNAVSVASEIRTGFMLRSELVNKWKALEVFGYSDEKPIGILRMESLTSEILLCIFDGELTRLVVSQPKTGLRFGAPDKSGIISIRNVNDTDDFGAPTGKTTNLKDFTEPNGRLRAADLAKDFQSKLGSTVTSPQFAFEMIAVAKRAEFLQEGKA